MYLLAAQDTRGRGEWGYADMSGTIIIRPQFAWAEDFSEGLAAVRVGISDKWGYIDRTGRIVIKPQFDIAHRFIGGIASIEIGHWVRRQPCPAAPGNTLPTQPPPGCIDDLIWDGEIGYIDRTGAYIWRPTK